MATTTDVQIRIIGKDDASGAFRQVASTAEASRRSLENLGNSTKNAVSQFNAAQRDVDAFNSSMFSLRSVLSNTAAYTTAIAGIGGIEEAFSSALESATEYYTTMESGAISLAGSLMSTASLNGEVIRWNEGLKLSKQIMTELSDQALVTGASTKEISNVFRAMLPNALNAGMSIEQTLKLASALTTTGKAMGLGEDILMQDVRNLITGNDVQGTVLGLNLGITNEEIKNARASGSGLYSFLTDKLRGEIEANSHYLQTFEGRLNHLKESISRVGGMGISGGMQDATDMLGKLANMLVQVDDKTHTVTGINGEVVESIQNAVIVTEHLGSSLLEVGKDVSTVAAPAFNVLAAAIELAAQHGTILIESAMAMWVGGKINNYVMDYRNAVTGAAEAHTFLGKAAQAARIQMEQEAAAQRALQISTVKNSLEAITSNSASTGRAALDNAAVAQRVVLESQLGTQLVRNAELEASRAVVMNTAKTAFTGALAAIQAGETELATRILQTSATLEAQGAAAEIMAARATQAINLVKMGQTELAERILQTTLANELQGTTGLMAGTKAATGAAAAKAAQVELAVATGTTTAATTMAGSAAVMTGAKTVTMGMTAGNAIKNLTSLAFGLAGGWIGVAVAIGMALYKLFEFAKEQSEFEKMHTFWYKGNIYIVNKDGEVRRDDTNTPIVPDYTGVGANDTVDYDTKKAILEMSKQRDEELKDAERQKQVEEAKKYMKDISKDLDNSTKNMLDNVGARFETSEGKEAAEAKKAAKEAEKAAREQAQANKRYADVITQNARAIEQSNQKIENILQSLDDKIFEETSSQLEADLRKAAQDRDKTFKEIASAAVTLKKYTPYEYSSSNGESSYGAGIYAYGASQNGLPYLLGGDGISATDCGKLFADAVMKVTGEEIPRRVDDLVSLAQEKGAWHQAGDGYTPNIGDGVVVLGDEHIVISNGRGGYVGANSSTGVIEKDSVSADFGTPTGYISIAQLLPQSAETTTQIATPNISQTSARIPQSPAVETIVKAAQSLGWTDMPLALAIAAKESGGGDVNNIGTMKYNTSSGATGMFQILDGQDFLGTDGLRHNVADMYPNYKTDDYENALAGLTMLMDKINNVAGGNIWRGVGFYGEGEEYANSVKDIYASLGGGGQNLAPTSYARYIPAGSQEAYQKANQYYQLLEEKARRENNIRVRKMQEEMTITRSDLELDGNPQSRIYSINQQEQADINANHDKLQDYYKQSNDWELARKYMEMQDKKIQSEADAKRREAYQTEHEEYQTHLESLGVLQEDFQADVAKRQQWELETFIQYQKEQLETAKLTTAQRIALEKSLVDNIQKLQELEARTDWGAGLEQMGRSMRSYSQDIGGALTEGWNSVSDTITGTFDNMLTENESFAARMKNMYVSVANTILNQMMKIIIQGLIMNAIMKVFGFGGTSFASSGFMGDLFGVQSSTVGMAANSGLSGAWQYHHSPTGFASGGFINPGYAIVGEHGRELIQMNGNGYVYNARETANIIRNANESANTGGVMAVQVQVINKSGQQVKATNTNAQIDGKRLIVSTMIEAIANDYMGTRTMIKGVR